MNSVDKKHHQAFDDLCRQAEDGGEYWSARDLQLALEYVQWRRFEYAIEKAKTACQNAGQSVEDHFAATGKMVALGSGAKREVGDYHLSRYACYLIVQNGDPGKPVIANGQTYFAIQTRRQELADDEAFRQLDEDKKRIFLRNELREHNKQLVETAGKAGVESGLDFAVFQNHGYRGLYGGLAAKDIHRKKQLKKSQQILDHMGSTELAANLFRATQTEEKLDREEIKGKSNANRAHFEVGTKVRQTIKDIGGAMPEDLPAPASSVKSLEKNDRKKLTDGDR